MGRILGRRMLLIVCGLAILFKESCAMEGQPATTVKADGNGDRETGMDQTNDQAQRNATTEAPAQNQGDTGGSADASDTTTKSGSEAENDQVNGQAQRNATTEAPAQNQGDTGGSADASGTTTKSGSEVENDQVNGQAQRNATTEAPAQNQGDTGGSADASGTTTKSGREAENDKGNGQAQRNATTEAPAQNQGDTGGSADASGTTTKSGGESEKDQGNGQAQRSGTTKAPAQNHEDTGGSADTHETTTKRDGFVGGNKNSGSTTTGKGVAQTEAPRQSGTGNEGGMNSTPAQSNHGSSDQKDTEHPRSDSAGGTYNETGTNQQAGTERNHQNTDSKDGQDGTERPTTKASKPEEARGTQDNGKEDAAQPMTTQKNNGGGNEEPRNEETQSDPTDEASDTGKKGDDSGTTRNPDETQQGNQEHKRTTTVPTDNRDHSSQGDKPGGEDGSGSVTDAPRQSEDSGQAKSTPKTNMNHRQQTESSSDQEKSVFVQTTTRPNSNEKQATGKPPPQTSPRTALDQRSQTEKTQDQDDVEHVRTTPRRTDINREGEKKGTERPNTEGDADQVKGTPAGETESSESGKTQEDSVKPTPRAGEENSSTVYRLPRLDLAESVFLLSDEDTCTPFSLTFSIPPPREGDDPSGTDDGDKTGTDGDGESTEIISYEDFSTLMAEQFSLPDLPFALGRQDANQLQGKTKRLMIDEVAFESDNQLVVEGKFCDMRSRLLELCLSLDGRTRIRTSDAPEGKCHNITLYSRAPELTSARLSDTADAVVIFFNKDVDATNLRECSAIFDNATLDLFGEDAQCLWRKGKELVVRLGKTSTIETGSSITLRENGIRAFRQRFSHTAVGSHDVNAPNNPVTPTARIDGMPEVPSCGSVKLSGLRSKGGGSRGLTYTWSLQSPREGVHEKINKINKILEKANDGNKADLVIPAALLVEDTPYTWTLNVRNIQDLDNSTTFTLRKATGQEPRFEIRTTGIPEVKPVKVTTAVSLLGDISFNRGPGCPKLSASNVEFQWSIAGAAFEEGEIPTNRRVLRFPPRTLPGNADITATLTVTYGAENPTTLTKSVTFSTAYESLMARIKGGESITTGVGSDSFTLNCSLSRDPNYEGDGPDDGLSFRWGCWQTTDKTSCLHSDLGSTTDILTVDPSNLTVGKVYSFSCFVDKDNFDEVHDSVTIMVAENNPPMISLTLLKSRNGAFRPGSDVELRATVSGDDISELNWEDVGGGLDGFGEDTLTNIKDTTTDEDETTVTTSDVTDADKPYTITIRQHNGKYYSLLRINKDRLRAGSQYEMQVSALNGEEEGTSTIAFQILAKVSGCQLEFGGNDSYVDTATDVSYSVQACAAEEDKILTYQAFATFPLDGRKPHLRLLGQTSEYPEIQVNHEVYDRVKRKTEANQEVSFQVGMLVCYQDTKICADFKKEVTYVHVPLTAEEMDAKKEEINDLKKEGRPVEGLKTANGAQKAITSQTAEGERKRRATVHFDDELLGLQKELLILASGDRSNYDGYPGDVISMVDAAVEVPIAAFQPEEMRDILRGDKSVLEAAKDLDERLPQETLDGIRQHLEDARMAFTDGKFFTENRAILGLLSKCMSKNLVTGERVTSYGDGILMTIEATLNIDPILIPKGDGDITFNGGDDVRNRYGASWEGCGCDECVGVWVEFFIYRGQDYVAGESHGSDVISLQFISPCTGDPMEVQDLEDPASMSIPFSSSWSPDAEPVCSYYDEDMMAWAQDGVKTVVDGMDVVCKTNHTTEYVIDFVIEGGAVAEPTATTTEGGEMITHDDDDDDDDDIDIPGLNGLLGLGIGVIVGIVLASLVILAIIIVLIAVVIKSLNKPKMIVEPVVKA